MFIILLFAGACRKTDTPPPATPVTPNQDIVIKASVPPLIYWDAKQVFLDASETNHPNTLTKLSFTWTCIEFPYTTAKPVIYNSLDKKAWIENPRIGQYKFQLTVKDNAGNIASSEYKLDVRGDTLIKAEAGPDQQIFSPREKISLFGRSSPYEFNYNVEKRLYYWSIIEKPAANNQVTINPYGSSNPSGCEITGLKEGFYKIKLEVKNEIGLSAYDTMEINVSPDPFKGSTKVFDNEVWERVPSDWGDYIAISIFDPVSFKDRTDENFEIRVWDEDKKIWADPDKFYWYAQDDGQLFIYYPDPANNNWIEYYKMEGVRARVQVKYL